MLTLKISLKYVKTLIKWVFFTALIGTLCGIIGNLFHHSIEIVTQLRFENAKIIYLLPLAGIIIAGMYSIFHNKGRLDTKRVINAANGKDEVPIVMLPLIFVCSTITHLVGGSSGREGAALQIGGSLGYNFSRIFKLNKNDTQTIVMAGMSAAFSALFGTPIAATVFTIELVRIDVSRYKTALVCFASSICGYFISLWLGAQPVRFEITKSSGYTFELLIKSILITVICAFTSIVFCQSIKKTEIYAKKVVKNVYLRGFIGGTIILALTFLVGTYDYNGAGMSVIEKALSGDANYEAFILKILFTAITVAAGFKGGEIVPAFFVGSTLGCVLGHFFGVDPGISAAIGFITLFCGITKCPFASFFLAIEVFGTYWGIIFVIVSIVSYIFSGKTGILKNKKDVL